MRRRGLWAACAVLLIGVGVLAVGTGYAKDENAKDEDATGAKCSEATLDGTYLFAFDGFILTGNDQVPFALAGYQVYNGNGKVKGVQSGKFGGEIARKERFSGTYTVKADCTATVTYTDGDPFRLDLFLAPDGSKFTLVQVNPSEWVTSGFELRGRPSESASEPLSPEGGSGEARWREPPPASRLSTTEEETRT